MLLLSEKQNTPVEPSQKLNSRRKQTRQRQQSVSEIDLLQAALEGFVDGILILTEQGEWVHANECARRICGHKSDKDTCFAKAVVAEIRRVCQSLIESHQLFPKQRIIIDSEIKTDETVKFRVRARWLYFNTSKQPLVLVTLEDCQQHSPNVAIADAKKYHLTEREAQVWQLRRANHSYKEIAAQLYITINTVKKHLKSIYAKQQELGLEARG